MKNNESTADKIRKFKIRLTVVLSAMAVLVLVVTALRDIRGLVYYAPAGELKNIPDKLVRVAGRVVEGSVVGELGDTFVWFTLIDDAADTVGVYYAGLRPDAFRDGALTVVEGKYVKDQDYFNALLLQAKCPSKYEVQTPDA